MLFFSYSVLSASGSGPPLETTELVTTCWRTARRIGRTCVCSQRCRSSRPCPGTRCCRPPSSDRLACRKLRLFHLIHLFLYLIKLRASAGTEGTRSHPTDGLRRTA